MPRPDKKPPVPLEQGGAARPDKSAARPKRRKKGAITFQSGRAFKKKDQALAHLRTEILSKNLKPGTLITAKGLAAEWGISRTPIRGAIDVLVKEGLLKRVGESGAVVRELNPGELFELLTLRFAIETMVARRLAWLNRLDKLRQLDELNERMRAAVADDSEEAWPGYYELDIEFHVTMAKLADMPGAANWIAELMNQFRLYALDYRGIAGIVHDEHKAITDSIRKYISEGGAGGFAEIDDRVRRHLKGTADRWVVDIKPLIDAVWWKGAAGTANADE